MDILAAYLVVEGWTNRLFMIKYKRHADEEGEDEKGPLTEIYLSLASACRCP